MALKTGEIARLAKKFDVIADEVPMVLSRAVNKYAKDGVKVAKRVLGHESQDHKFTQKYGSTLVNEIGSTRPVSRRSKKINRKIIAPISDDIEMQLQMFFAEYGAGLTTDPETPQIGYAPTQPKKNIYAIGTRGGGLTLSNAWYYPAHTTDSNPFRRAVWHTRGKKSTGNRTVWAERSSTAAVANQSKPIGYMKAARRLLTDQRKGIAWYVGEELSKAIIGNKRGFSYDDAIGIDEYEE